jgi:hypothetical protein
MSKPSPAAAAPLVAKPATAISPAAKPVKPAAAPPTTATPPTAWQDIAPANLASAAIVPQPSDKRKTANKPAEKTLFATKPIRPAKAAKIQILKRPSVFRS